MKNKTLEPIGSIQIGGIEFEYYGDIYEPLFLAKQVATLLNERDGSTVARKVRESEKHKEKVVIKGKYEQVQNYTLLTETGLFLSIQNSNKLDSNKKREIIKELKEQGLFKKLIVDSRKEVEFVSQLEQALQPFGVSGKCQYNVNGYRIDYYIPSMNVAIEYDENDHNGYAYEKQELRQQIIEEQLGCKFIRVSDSKPHAYNVGLVIKELFCAWYLDNCTREEVKIIGRIEMTKELYNM